jgi:hypothetical protein
MAIDVLLTAGFATPITSPQNFFAHRRSSVLPLLLSFAV